MMLSNLNIILAVVSGIVVQWWYLFHNVKVLPHIMGTNQSPRSIKS